MTRIGRGHRDARDVNLRREVRELVRRSQRPRDYGNPYISISDDLRQPLHLDRAAAKSQGIHRRLGPHGEDRLLSKKYYRLKSANHGYTVVVKDNIVTADLPTTCASKILKGLRPVSQHSTITDRLNRAGMRVLAKTNMDEFGMGSHSMNSAYGPVTNGRSFKALSVGGSSGGSALAVAAKLAHIGIGTDTGGSIRLPAAYMSVLGFKPSYGMISRKGVIPYANSLDTVGIIARSAQEIRLTFDILRKPDENDPTCLTSSSFARVQEAKNRRRVAVLGSKYVVVATDEIQDSDASQNLPSDWPWRKLRSQLVAQRKFTRRVGVPLEYNIAEMHPLVRWAWTATLSFLETIGCEIVPISLPSTRHALSSYYVLAPAEASSNLAKYDGVRYGAVRESPSDDAGGTLYSKHRSDNFGPEVKRRILLGTYSLSAGAMDNYFIQAQKIRRMVQQDFDDVFRMPNPFKQDAEVNMNGVDFIIAPTAPSPPPRLRYLQRSTPVENYMNDVFTVPASLAGLPSMSVPAPRHPDHAWRPEVAVGMQIIGQYGDDYSVMYLAQNYMTNFHPTAGMKRVQTHKILT